MEKGGPVIVVDDDHDDLEVLEEAYRTLNLPNDFIALDSGIKLIEYLRSSKERPFIIICDYNLPMMNGLEIRKMMFAESQTHYRSIPFVLLSTAMNKRQIKKSFDNEIQGFFTKPTSFEDIAKTLSAIMTYWQFSEHPEEEY